MMLSPNSLFGKAAQAGASDVHLVAGHPVVFRKDGELLVQDGEKLTKNQVSDFIKSVLGQKMYAKFEEEREADFSYGLEDGVRLRVNCHFEKGNSSLSARIVPTKIPSLDDIGFTDSLKGLCGLSDGLILFTGPTGHGKSTSVAAIIEHINSDRARNIITLEDPIEFIFPIGKSLIRQRQFGEDFYSFPEALKRVVRQDPNIIMVGEMRDHETVAAALTLAETGHLILATLHTPNAIQAVNRIIDMFPAHQQNQIRSQLSLSLRAFIAQQLVPKKGGGRLALRECLMNVPAVSNIIRENRLQEISSVLQSGKKSGMCTFEQDRERLIAEGLVEEE